MTQTPPFGLHGFPPDSFKAIPIVFLYRHAMELYLKAVILEGAGMLTFRGESAVNTAVVLSCHSLIDLLRIVERIFRAFGWSWDLGVPHFKSLSDFRAIVQELENVDGGSYTFRYPTKKDGKTGSLKRHFRFNLFEFCQRLDPVFPLLAGAAYAAGEELQNLYEQDAEAREYDALYSDPVDDPY